MKKKPEISPKTPRLKLIVSALAGVVLIVLLVVFFSVKKDSTAPERKEISQKETVTPSARQENPDSNTGMAMIQAVHLQPALPTKLDTIKAEVIPMLPDSSLKYSYVWKVNNEIIADATGDTLDLSPFKKSDLVSVTVTPYDGDTPGYKVNSPTIAIQSIPPSLELKVISRTAQIGAPYVLQLFSDHPDSETVVFSLEEPKIDGMTIDGQSGKITWLIRPNQQGNIQFGAAVVDAEGTRVKKTFEINLN